MRSLFWRILGAFWLALLLTGALTFLLTYLFNQDTWLINRHPQLQHLAVNWLDLSAQEQQLEAQQLLDQLHQQQRIFVQVFDAEGQLLASSTRQRSAPRRSETTSSRFSVTESSPTSWRRLSQEINNSLSIAASAAVQLQGCLNLTNHPHTGFIASLNWPMQKLTPTQA